MNKCYEHHCWVKPGGQPKKHYNITNIKKGYDKTHWGKFQKNIDKLQKEDLLITFPHPLGNRGFLRLCPCWFLRVESHDGLVSVVFSYSFNLIQLV